MTDSGWLFLFTPIPYLIAMYLTAYRHDLGRIARRVQDRATKRDWWLVCNRLGLVGTEVRAPTRKTWRSPLLLSVLLTSLISFSWVVVPVRLTWYFLFTLQMMGALPLLVGLTRITGPVPFRPYGDVLPFPRLGTRIRHLVDLKRTSLSP